MGIRIPKLNGIYGIEIQPGKDFGQDIIEKTELISGVPRSYLFHSDEINQKAFRRIHEKKMSLKRDDFQKNFFFQNLTIDLHKKITKSMHMIGPGTIGQGLRQHGRGIHRDLLTATGGTL